MKSLQNIIISTCLIFICMGSTCLNHSSITDILNPSLFKVLDSYIAIQIDQQSDLCLEESEDREDWDYCMRNHYEMEALLEVIKTNLEGGEEDQLKNNLSLLVSLMDLCDLDIPQGLKSFLE